MKTLKESILDRLEESILSSNNAGSIPARILAIFREIDTPSRLTELKKLWDEYGLSTPKSYWSRSITTEGYDYSDESDHREKLLLAIREGTYIYMRKDVLESKYREKLIKIFGLKQIKLKGTNEGTFETYEF